MCDHLKCQHFGHNSGQQLFQKNCIFSKLYYLHAKIVWPLKILCHDRSNSLIANVSSGVVVVGWLSALVLSIVGISMITASS